MNIADEHFSFNKNPTKRFQLGNATTEVIFLLQPCTALLNTSPDSEEARVNAVIERFPMVCKTENVLDKQTGLHKKFNCKKIDT